MKLYRGVIEDNNNPSKNGTVRVRVIGVHTENNENSSNFDNVSTEQLPWAEIISGIEFSLVSGIGLSSIPKNGTHVWVTFENDDYNKPIVIGSITGTQSSEGLNKYSEGKGFCDPKGEYPLQDRIDEHDLNRLVRGEKLSDTVHGFINSNLDSVSKTDGKSGANVSQSEPSSTNELSEYTKTTVVETQSGHTIELDDTQNNERIRVYHKSGSYIEIKPDGSIVQKSVSGSASHYIHYGDVEKHIKQNVKNYIESNLDEIIGGYVHRHIQGELKEHVTGNITKDSDGNVQWNIGGNFSLQVSGNIDIDGSRIDLN